MNPLTPQEKTILRMAIFDGVFNDDSHTISGRVPTANVLESISLLSNEEVRKILDVYKKNKEIILSTHLARASSQKSDIESALSSLKS